ncbi:PAS domain S-box protein [Maribellus maritimus]|uniref:PAS domain S-box protein n=1 Tax=Maribellus maritimus TaxID=2870838 RepID=UPI001EEA761A|nr:PAS domain S-box protein [Maribellus maritimus]MCG6190084.1 PAS domain S-box protein [Maribellus maritimus]
MRYKTSADEILKVLPVTYYVINYDSRKIIQSNDPNVAVNKSICCEYLCFNDNACEKPETCVCHKALESGKSSCIIEKGNSNSKEFYNAEFSPLGKEHLVVSVRNVTDEFFTKKELKINTKRLNRAERLADFGNWEFNIDDKIMIASDGAVKIYGARANQFSLEEAQSFPLKKYRKELDKALKDLINIGKPYNVKFEIKHPIDGKIRRIRSIAEYREDKRMVFGVIHDITETEEAQKALGESENNLKHLFKNMNSGFAYHKIITDKNGKPVDYVFLEVNRKFEEIIGLKREEILNRRVSDILPNTEQFWIERYGKVALTGKPDNFSEYGSYTGKYFEVSAYSPKKKYFAITFTDITQRVQSEIDLKESLEDLRMAQKYAKIGNWKYNAKTEKVQWSEQVFEIFERKPSLGVIKPFETPKYLSEKDIKKLDVAVTRALVNNTASELQVRIILPGNKTKWVEIICQPAINDDQKSEGQIVQGTIQDITDSKNAEEELNTTNKLLRTVIDNIPDAIYMKDTQYRKLIANKGDALHCGVNDVSEIIGKSDYDIYPKEVADIYTEDDRRVIEKGETIINREELLPSGDKNRIILTSKFPLKNDNDKIIGLVGIGRDITELKESQSKLNLFQYIIYQTPLSVMITGINGEIEYVNPGFTDATGYKPEEVIGKEPGFLKSGFTKPSHYKELWNSICSGKTWHGEFLNKKKDGTYFWENAIIAPVFDDDGRIIHFVAIKENITEKKQIIEDLKIAKEKAEESNRLKSTFLTNLSHEIRTPLNGILGFSNLICSGIADAERLKYYGEIVEASGRRLTKVIEDIIDMSMLHSNQLKFEISEFNLDDVFEELYNSYKESYKGKLADIEFVFKVVKNENSIVKSDRVRIKQALSNIIENAFRFTEKGFIKFGYFGSDDEHVILFVEDSGIGIEGNKSKIIFEAFRQGEEGDSRKYEGSGLGLTISEAIMEKLGGGVEFESKKGEGSVFYLKFKK